MINVYLADSILWFISWSLMWLQKKFPRLIFKPIFNLPNFQKFVEIDIVLKNWRVSLLQYFLFYFHAWTRALRLTFANFWEFFVVIWIVFLIFNFCLFTTPHPRWRRQRNIRLSLMILKIYLGWFYDKTCLTLFFHIF